MLTTIPFLPFPGGLESLLVWGVSVCRVWTMLEAKQVVSSGRRAEAGFLQGIYGSTDAVTHNNAGSHDSCHLPSACWIPGHLSPTTVLHSRCYYITVLSQVCKPSF